MNLSVRSQNGKILSLTFLLFFIFGINTSLISQCVIGDIEVSPSPCDELGFFDVFLDFDYEDTGNEGFTAEGNGVTYGNFEYSALPIVINDLEGDGITFYEFVVRDIQFPDCSNFAELGIIECFGGLCNIWDLIIDDHPCENGMFSVYIDFEYENVSDTGFALYVNYDLYGTYTYADLKSYLIDIEGFTGYKENEFVFIWTDKTQVDLIPFGDLEREGIVTVKGTGFTSMNVEGFREVFEQASEEIETENQRFKVCTLPGIVILKLIAWDDRPEVRKDDIDDIAEIIKNYFHLNDEKIFEHHSDLFTDEIELDEIASQFLGREIGKIISGNPKLIKRINGILENGLADSNNLAELFASESYETIDYSKSLISHMLKGIADITTLDQ